MANIYVRSTDGSDSDNGSTWALAKATLAGAAAIDAAGDTIYVSQDHASITAGAVSLAINSSVSAPSKIICGNDAAEPPTALATSATVTTTGNSSISPVNGSGFQYISGIQFIAGSGASGTASIAAGNSLALSVFESCSFQLATTGASSRITHPGIGANGHLKNCTFKFGAAGQSVQLDGGNGHIQGGSLLSGGVSPTSFFIGTSVNEVLIEDFDFSNGDAAMNLMNYTAAGHVVIRNCKLPASWSGLLNAGNTSSFGVVEMFNCDGGDTNYRYRKASQFGTIQDEETIVRTGGANDGTTSWSLKLVTTADAEFPLNTIDTPERVRWNDTVGTPITLTVHIVRDSLTNLTDKEIWLEVDYLGTSGVPLGSPIDDRGGLIASAADQTTSAEVWTTTGLTNPNEQQLSVTFTPQEAGYIHYKVRLAKASTTVYVDQKAVIS